jgi:PAS domain S-box-containing protein
VYVSPSCERITGYPQEEFQKNPRLIKDISHPDDRRLIADHLELEKESKEAFSLDFRIITRGGEERWLGHVCQPVYSANGSLLGRRATNRDISKRKHAEKEREKLVQELQDALAKVKTLSGLLPICASCKKIRDDHGYWTQLEAYIRDHSEAEFSHSICPECKRKLYGDV